MGGKAPKRPGKNSDHPECGSAFALPLKRTGSRFEFCAKSSKVRSRMNHSANDPGNILWPNRTKHLRRSRYAMDNRPADWSSFPAAADRRDIRHIADYRGYFLIFVSFMIYYSKRTRTRHAIIQTGNDYDHAERPETSKKENPHQEHRFPDRQMSFDNLVRFVYSLQLELWFRLF